MARDVLVQSALALAPLNGVQRQSLTPVVVRRWHAAALRGVAAGTWIAQSYRFLRAVLNAAVREGAIAKKPVPDPRRQRRRARERTVASLVQIAAFVEAITPPGAGSGEVKYWACCVMTWTWTPGQLPRVGTTSGSGPGPSGVFTFHAFATPGRPWRRPPAPP